MLLFSKTLLGYRRTPPHTQQVLPSHGSKLDFIVRHIAYTAAGCQAVVLHHGFNGILDGQLHQSCPPDWFFSCFFLYCLSKTRGSRVCGLSIPVQTVKQTDTG